MRLEDGVGGVEGSPRLLLRGLSFVEIAGGDCRRLGQLLRPLVFRFGELQLGLGNVHTRRGLIDLGLVGARINLKQQIALLHVAAFRERHLRQITRDPRHDANRLHRLKSASEHFAVSNLALDHATDLDEGRFGQGRFRLVCGPTDRRCRQEQDETNWAGE